jgi:LysR family transcriptional regulator, mexEF-oprN operon transcriptional activator
MHRRSPGSSQFEMTPKTLSGKSKVMNTTFSEIELRKLDLNLLLVFSALMRERSVSRASRRLHIGPPAVSMALARLRATIGDDLLVRAGPGMEPTERALALWAELEPALSAIESAVRGARGFDPLTDERVIRFAVPDDLEFVLVPHLLERLAVEAPRMRLVVRPSDFRTLLGRLDSGDADLALSATPESGIERRHRILPIHRDGFAVLYDAAQLGCTGSLDLNTYLAVPHILLSIVGDLRGNVDERLAEMGRSRRVLSTVSHFPTLPFILKRLPVLANMPSLAACYYAETYGLERCPPPIESPRFKVSLAWHVRTDVDPAYVWLRRLVVESVKQLIIEKGADSLCETL